jgi:gentisate 1,2-dioxygenase
MTSPADRAIYYKPELAFDRGAPALAPHLFAAERDAAFAAASSGWIPLDLSDRLQVSWPCTTPAMLARYGTLCAGDRLESRVAASGCAYYVLRGTGTTTVSGQTIEWTAGDVFVVPGFAKAAHRAAIPTILFEASDAPLFGLLGASRKERTAQPVEFAHFQARRIEEGLREVHARKGEQKSAGKSVVFVTPACAALRLLTPTLLASINSLEPGGDQRPHRHSSAALTLSVAGERVFSCVDGKRLDWVYGAVTLTPPGAVHSHHNRGSDTMLSFVVQDTGLHTHLQTTAFEWATEDHTPSGTTGGGKPRNTEQEASR